MLIGIMRAAVMLLFCKEIFVFLLCLQSLFIFLMLYLLCQGAVDMLYCKERAQISSVATVGRWFPSQSDCWSRHWIDLLEKLRRAR